MCTDHLRRGQRGLTLIELVIFIVVVSVGLAGILSVLNLTVMHSADPMARKQAIAAAEALMEEVALQPFTYCEPSDAHLTTAAPNITPAVDTCTTTPSAAGKSRYSDPRYNNVNNYAGFAMPGGVCAAGICDVNNVSSYLAGYTASVAVTNAGTAFNGINGTGYRDDAVQKIVVTVTGQGQSIALTSYRFRYAPNSP